MRDQQDLEVPPPNPSAPSLFLRTMQGAAISILVTVASREVSAMRDVALFARLPALTNPSRVECVGFDPEQPQVDLRLAHWAAMPSSFARDVAPDRRDEVHDGGGRCGAEVVAPPPAGGAG